MTTPEQNEVRALLRRRLLSERQQWATTPAVDAAQTALEARLWDVLAQLEPECLGVYSPMKGEFNPRALAVRAQTQWGCHLALPFSQREPVAMHFRAWDGDDLSTVDECGLPSPTGKPVVPDVVLVPCLGFTADGYRLGYGGGYFDRFMAAHPEVTAIGVGWHFSLLTADAFEPADHDQPLTVVITDRP